MKSTGIVRNVDDLNRFVIPREITRTMDINHHTPLEVLVDGENIILRKYEPGCVFCGSVENIVNYKGKNICQECAAAIQAA